MVGNTPCVTLEGEKEKWSEERAGRTDTSTIRPRCLLFVPFRVRVFVYSVALLWTSFLCGRIEYHGWSRLQTGSYSRVKSQETEQTAPHTRSSEIHYHHEHNTLTRSIIARRTNLQYARGHTSWYKLAIKVKARKGAETRKGGRVKTNEGGTK